jgi:hypothetical protein
MAVELIFVTSNCNTQNLYEVKVFADSNNEISITIEDIWHETTNHICFDRSTAIKLSKELRKQIALLD